MENEETHLYGTVNWFMSVDIKQPGNSELDNRLSQVGMVGALSNEISLKIPLLGHRTQLLLLGLASLIWIQTSQSQDDLALSRADKGQSKRMDNPVPS